MKEKNAMTQEALLNMLEDLNEAKKKLEAEAKARKKASQDLIESEKKFRSIFDSSEMGMHVYELKGDKLIFRGANKAASKILGVGCKQFISKTIEQAFPPLAKTEVPNAYKKVAKSGGVWRKEQITYHHGKISGSYYVVAFQTSKNNMVASFIDITKRKEEEESLKESKEKCNKRIKELEQQIKKLKKSKSRK